jgi:hypothetical protein
MGGGAEAGQQGRSDFNFNLPPLIWQGFGVQHIGRLRARHRPEIEESFR